MPPETPQGDAPDLLSLVKTLQLTADMVHDDTQQLREENRELRIKLGAITDRLTNLDERTGDIAADVARVARMADEAAAAYAASPVGKLMASRRKLKAPDGPAT